jgi:hypothetical protein
MVVTRESLSKKFSLYSDAELLEEYRSGGLTELATEVAKAELAKRGIDAAKPAPPHRRLQNRSPRRCLSR